MTAEAKIDAQIIEWYRVDDSRRIVTVLISGSFLLLVGSLVFAWAIASGSLYVEARIGFTLIGVSIVASGPLTSLYLLMRIMKRETCLIVRADGIVDRTLPSPGSGDLSLSGAEGIAEVLAWNDIDSIKLDEDGRTLRFVFREGRDDHLVSARFSGYPQKTIAKRLEEVRRKAVWNLLDSLPPPEKTRQRRTSEH